MSDSQKLYVRQMEEINDRIILGNIPLPNIQEVNNFSALMGNLNKFRWLDINDSSLSGEIIAGSYLSSFINKNIEYEDIDIYFKSEAHMDAWCTLNHIKVRYHAHMLCAYVKQDNLKINLIIGVPHSSPQDLIAGFDIRACAIAYQPIKDTLYIVDGAVEDCNNKRIVYQIGARAVTIRRLIKYLKKGFTITNSQSAILVELLKISSNRDQELLGGYKGDGDFNNNI